MDFTSYQVVVFRRGWSDTLSMGSVWKSLAMLGGACVVGVVQGVSFDSVLMGVVSGVCALPVGYLVVLYVFTVRAPWRIAQEQDEVIRGLEGEVSALSERRD